MFQCVMLKRISGSIVLCAIPELTHYIKAVIILKYPTRFDFVGALIEEFPEIEKTLMYDEEKLVFTCIRFKSIMKCICDQTKLAARTVYEDQSKGYAECKYDNINSAIRMIKGFYSKSERIAEYNPLCRDCELKEMKHVCAGSCDNFHYCFRRIGNVKGIEKTICQGLSMENIIRNSNILCDTDYDVYFLDEMVTEGTECCTMTLFGQLIDNNNRQLTFPLGFVRCEK